MNEVVCFKYQFDKINGEWIILLSKHLRSLKEATVEMYVREERYQGTLITNI